MKKTVFLFLPFALFAQTSFITPMEYASQLYRNPRGIGCQHCHGEDAKGKLIATYTSKNKSKAFRGPAINNLTYARFFQKLNKHQRGMPRYFLTQNEIQTLYLYVTKESNTTKDLQK